MLRDVREGIEPDPRPDPATGPSRRGTAVPVEQARSHELLSAVIGKAFVVIPVGAILVFGLWTGYEQGVGGGMSAGIAALVSVASLVATVGLAFLWAAMRRKH